MKNIFIIGLMFLTLYSCESGSKNKIDAEKETLDSLEREIQLEERVDSVMKTLPNMFEEKDVQMIPKSISILKFYTSSPNSAGGVDCNIVWKNISDKTVKYARFAVAPYNAVDDMVESEIGGATYKRLQATGPVKQGETNGYNTSWETIWYNSTIAYMKITGIELEYMDGSKISTNNPELINQVIPKKSRK